MSPFSSLELELVAQKSQNNGYFSNLLECAIADRAAIEAPRSDAPKTAMRSIASRASRSDTTGASQVMTRRGVKGEAPPARHHRAIADAPPGIINSPSRVSNLLPFRCACLLRESTRPHFNPEHWLLCHMGLYLFEFE